MRVWGRRRLIVGVSSAVLVAGCGAEDGAQPSPSRLVHQRSVLAARDAVVRIVVIDCRGQDDEATGFLVGPGLVATAAHIAVKGSAPVVQRHGAGPLLPATLTYVDRVNDLALLRVPALRQAALTLAAGPPRRGPGAILGFAGKRSPLASVPFRITPVVIDRSLRTRVNQDGVIAVRNITALRTGHGESLAAGNALEGLSGGPLLDTQGHVVGVTIGLLQEERGRWLPFASSLDALRRAITARQASIRRTCRGARGPDGVLMRRA
jgi:S1-C subfamily serine protease